MIGVLTPSKSSILLGVSVLTSYAQGSTTSILDNQLLNFCQPLFHDFRSTISLQVKPSTLILHATDKKQRGQQQTSSKAICLVTKQRLPLNLGLLLLRKQSVEGAISSLVMISDLVFRCTMSSAKFMKLSLLERAFCSESIQQNNKMTATRKWFLYV